MVGALAFFGQRSMIYFPDSADPGPAAQTLATGTDVTVRTADGLDLQAWLIGPTRGDRHVAVLYLPGNGGNRAGRADVAEALAAQGFTVLLLDYRGFGGNPGRPSEAGLVRDAEAAMDHLTEHGFPPQRTIIVGESIGTGVAAHLALTEDPAAVLLRSPYTSLGAVARAAYGIPLGWALRDRFDSLEKMPRIQAPVSVLYGTADTVIPPAQSREIAAAAPHLVAEVEVDGAGHNDTLWFGSFLAEQVAALADSAR